MPHLPNIANVECQRLRFAPGDRILVRVYTKLDKSQRDSLRKSICKFAGCEVEVLIYDATIMDISVEKGQHTPNQLILKGG